MDNSIREYEMTIDRYNYMSPLLGVELFVFSTMGRQVSIKIAEKIDHRHWMPTNQPSLSKTIS